MRIAENKYYMYKADKTEIVDLTNDVISETFDFNRQATYNFNLQSKDIWQRIATFIEFRNVTQTNVNGTNINGIVTGKQIGRAHV